MSTDGFELVFEIGTIFADSCTHLACDQSPRRRISGAGLHSNETPIETCERASRRRAASGVTVNCLHPGVVATNLLPRWLQIVKPWITRVTFDTQRGARSTLHLALEPALKDMSGRYFDENHVIQTAASLANDIAVQEALWVACAWWTGIPVD
jgi:NAD(P)-dependent dehydrogenase (short-subunit alcohol dehydrogenase family)